MQNPLFADWVNLSERQRIREENIQRNIIYILQADWWPEQESNNDTR
jgi:hypothetical protein